MAWLDDPSQLLLDLGDHRGTELMAAELDLIHLVVTGALSTTGKSLDTLVKTGLASAAPGSIEVEFTPGDDTLNGGFLTYPLPVPGL